MYMYTSAEQDYMSAYEARQTESYIRVLHAAPDAPPVDIYINNNPVLRNLPYKQASSYLMVPSGTVNLKVFPTGQTTTPVINTNVAVPPRAAFTVAAVGKLPEINLLFIPQPFIPQLRQTGQAYIRFVHLSPTAPSVDVTLPDGTKLINDIEFKEVSQFVPVNPGIYALQVRPVGSNQVVLTLPRVNVLPNGVYTIYAVGEADGTPPLEALLSPDTMA